MVAGLTVLEHQRNGRLLELMVRETRAVGDPDQAGYFRGIIEEMPEPDQRRLNGILEAAAPGDPEAQFAAARQMGAAWWQDKLERDVAAHRAAQD